MPEQTSSGDTAATKKAVSQQSMKNPKIQAMVKSRSGSDDGASEHESEDDGENTSSSRPRSSTLSNEVKEKLRALEKSLGARSERSATPPPFSKDHPLLDPDGIRPVRPESATFEINAADS